ncbi:MAG: hypothetical protein MJB57_08090, partial [Gemmatimonadetes bacterium]|nr:hypothetical protein [Gemmatimonadota bacterium]
SFMPGEHRGNRAIVAVPNPLSAEESYLRAGMVPVLLRRVEHNFARGHRDVRLFEIGTVFDYGEGSGIERFAEARRVGVVLTGGRTPAHWSGLADDLDAWDLKAIVERVARLVGGRTIPAPAGDDENALGSAGWLGTGAFAIETDDGLVGLAGPVRDAALDMPPWAAPAFALEFDLDAVRPRDHATYRETSPFPAVRRDLSVTVPARVRAGDVEVAVRGAASDLLENVRLFDVYAGEELGEGRRALGWAFRFRAPDRTLTDDEVESEMGAVSGALEEQFDAEIRSS